MSKAMQKIEKKEKNLARAVAELESMKRGVKEIEKVSKDDEVLDEVGLTTPAYYFTWHDAPWMVGYDEDLRDIRVVCVDPGLLVDNFGEKMAEKLDAGYTPEVDEENEEDEEEDEENENEDEDDE